MPELEFNAVHVWTAPLDETPARVTSLAAVLSPDERQRAERFQFAEHRRRFCVARATLRCILARYLRIEPRQVVFSFGPRGKPHLDRGRHATDIHFNLSHSHELAIYAVAWRRRVGIDLEYMQTDFRWRGLLQRYFSPDERHAIEGAPAARQYREFFRLWTRKEALAKAFEMDLDAVLRGAGPLSGGDALRAHHHATDDDALSWHVQELALHRDYAAALVVEGAPRPVEYRSLA